MSDIHKDDLYRFIQMMSEIKLDPWQKEVIKKLTGVDALSVYGTKIEYFVYDEAALIPKGVWKRKVDWNKVSRDLKNSASKLALARYDKSVKGTEEANPLCTDLDMDCLDVGCKITCWLYAPEKGPCPFLDPSVLNPLVPKE